MATKRSRRSSRTASRTVAHSRQATGKRASPKQRPFSLLDLEPHDDEGLLRVVVESPAGSRVKLKYEPDLRAFVLSRPLPLGVAYPFDWGFVPGTRADDGDPLDAMIVLDAPTWPGVVIATRPLAVLRVEQDSKDHSRRERNDRLLVVPASAKRPHPALSRRLQLELEEFFRVVTVFEDKRLEILGWGSAADAARLVARSRAD
jgi:inorganic pyrophosphatase